MGIQENNIQIRQVMKDFLTYLSTAPVVGLAWISFTAGFIIEINRFFPDPLIFMY
jgi:photosystem I subunit 9